MSYGIIEYNEEGLPMCEICGKHYKRVLSHVRQVHDMSEREYKLEFGFDLKKGICSKESSAISRDRVLDNFDRCVGQNLLKNGSKSRFKVGGPGRTKDKVSAQTRIRLKERLKTETMKESMAESGRKVGISGKGNEVRWKNKLKN